MLYIDKMPGKDGFGHVYSEKVVPGGSSANVAVAVKELGNIVLQSGKIADDSFGVIIENNLKEEGIEYKISGDRTRWGIFTYVYCCG